MANTPRTKSPTVTEAAESPTPVRPKLSIWARMIGYDENFTLGDKWITGGIFGWSMFWFDLFIVGTFWNLISPWPLSFWSSFWHVKIVTLAVFMATVTSLWFTWGGIRDIRDLFRRLKVQTINHLDDGTVVNHQNLDEVSSEEEPVPALPAKNT